MTENRPIREWEVRPLAQLTRGLLEVPRDVLVSDIALDSRHVSPGALFLACRGRTHHGLEFALQAVERGARAVLYEETDAAARTPDFGSEIFVKAAPQLSRNVSLLADRFFGHPSRSMTVAGITGTNGKTTCAYLLAQALGLLDRPAAYMGTLGFGLPAALTRSDLTTADAVSVQRRLAELHRLGAECIAMEVSSHALDQGRVAAVRFHTAVFTNLTRDHLDYHGTMARYAATKAQLCAWPELAVRIINIDDPYGAELARQGRQARQVVTTRAASRPEDCLGEFVRTSAARALRSGLSADIESSWGTGELHVPLIGEFNLDNALAVLAVLLSWEVPLARACEILAHCTAPPGRMELLGPGPWALVDYAHTPDALAKALHAAREHCRGRLHVVFGCGGDRDAGKRPLMGSIAARLADRVVLTDDNPRSESPQAIIAAIRAGIESDTPVVIEHDRAHAIRATLAAAAPDDMILIAGKGHEDYQIYGNERRPFSDQAVVRDYFAGAAA